MFHAPLDFNICIGFPRRENLFFPQGNTVLVYPFVNFYARNDEQIDTVRSVLPYKIGPEAILPVRAFLVLKAGDDYVRIIFRWALEMFFKKDIQIVRKLFSRHNYIMTTAELIKAKQYYADIKQLLDKGLIEKIKRGYYH